MPMKVTYHTVNGEIKGQTKDGVRTHFLTDALGSVTTTLSDAGQVENTYRYKPYGGLLAKTGVAADPRFMWRGSDGVRTVVSLMFNWPSANPYSSVLGCPVALSANHWRANGYSVGGNPMVGDHKFCTGCKSTDPDCPSLEILCKYQEGLDAFAEIFRKIAKAKCVCGLRYVATVHLKIQSGCFEAKGVGVGKGEKEIPPVCNMKAATIMCKSVTGHVEKKCDELETKCHGMDCGPEVEFPGGPPRPLPSSVDIVGPYGLTTIKLRKLKGTIQLDGKFWMRRCKKRPLLCDSTDGISDV